MKNKKIIATLIATTILAVSTFAIDFSIGANVDADFIGQSRIGAIQKNSRTLGTLGINGFLDADYVMASVGAKFLAGPIREQVDNKRINLDSKISWFNFGVFAKYPFKLAMVKIYPIIGFDFNFCMSAKQNGISSPQFRKENNGYYFDLGLGSDIMLGSNFFVRPSAMFGIKLNKSKLDEFRKDLGGTVFNYKVNLGIGFGYKF